MSERYKKLTSHGAISIPVAMRRDIGLQGGDPSRYHRRAAGLSSSHMFHAVFSVGIQKT